MRQIIFSFFFLFNLKKENKKNCEKISLFAESLENIQIK